MVSRGPEPPPLPPPGGGHAVPPRAIGLAALAAGVLAGTLLFFRSPSGTPGLYPPCAWHAATLTYCPGCGITRALHELLHGRVLAALDYNAAGLLVLLAAAAVLVKPGWIALRENRWAPPTLPRHTARWLLFGGLLWALLRNLPWTPFTVLAP